MHFAENETNTWKSKKKKSSKSLPRIAVKIWCSGVIFKLKELKALEVYWKEKNKI